MTMFEEAPKTITAMTEKELRQDNWRLKGKIDKLTAQIEDLKFRLKEAYNDDYAMKLVNTLMDENLKLRTTLGFNELKELNSPEAIIEELCKVYSVTNEQLKSKSRKKEVAQVRHLVSYVLYEKKNSLKSIGKLLGNRDHSTIIHSKSEGMGLIAKMQEHERDFILRLIHSL